MLHIELFAGAQSADRNPTVCEWSVRAADFWTLSRTQKIRVACTDHCATAVGIQKDSGALVDGDVANLGCTAILQDSCHEDQRASHAIAGGEMGVRKHILQEGIGQKIVHD